MTDVDDLLSRLELEEHSAAFAENAIDIETLEYLSDDDLKEIGFTKLGHRRKIMAAIGRLGRVAGPSPPAVQEIDIGASLPDGERRQVTVLFADISGFTRLSKCWISVPARGRTRSAPSYAVFWAWALPMTMRRPWVSP